MTAPIPEGSGFQCHPYRERKGLDPGPQTRWKERPRRLFRNNSRTRGSRPQPQPGALCARARGCQGGAQHVPERRRGGTARPPLPAGPGAGRKEEPGRGPRPSRRQPALPRSGSNVARPRPAIGEGGRGREGAGARQAPACLSEGVRAGPAAAAARSARSVCAGPERSRRCHGAGGRRRRAGLIAPPPHETVAVLAGLLHPAPVGAEEDDVGWPCPLPAESFIQVPLREYDGQPPPASPGRQGEPPGTPPAAATLPAPPFPSIPFPSLTVPGWAAGAARGPPGRGGGSCGRSGERGAG